MGCRLVPDSKKAGLASTAVGVGGLKAGSCAESCAAAVPCSLSGCSRGACPCECCCAAPHPLSCSGAASIEAPSLLPSQLLPLAPRLRRRREPLPRRLSLRPDALRPRVLFVGVSRTGLPGAAARGAMGGSVWAAVDMFFGALEACTVTVLSRVLRGVRGALASSSLQGVGPMLEAPCV
jgi:hypothetical protein